MSSLTPRTHTTIEGIAPPTPFGQPVVGYARRPVTASGPGDPPNFRPQIVRSLRMHPRLAIGVGVGIFLLLVVAAMLQPRVYLAQSFVYVEPVVPGSIGPQGMPGFDQFRYASYVDQQMQTVIRPDILAAALRTLPPGTWRGASESEQSAVLRLQRALVVERVLTSYQISIKLKTSNAENSAAIVNAVTNAYLRGGRRDELTQADSREQLLTEERQRIKDEMETDRREQASLGASLGVANPASEAGNPYDSQLATIRAELAAARQAHEVAAAQLSSVSGQTADQRSGLAAAADETLLTEPGLSSMKTSVNARRAVLESQMAGLTPSNPLYKQDQDEIADLDRSLDAMTAKTRANAERRIEDRLRSELQRTSAVEGGLNAQLAQMTSQATGAGPKLQRAGELSADIQRLTVRYATVDDDLRSLQLETNGPGMAHIALAAAVPASPEPNRRNLLLWAALPFGLLFGVGSAVFARARDRRLYVAADVEQAIGFAPITVLPARADVPPRVIEEYVLRLAAGVEGAYRTASARAFVVTPVGARTDAGGLLHALAAQLRDLRLKIHVLRAPELLTPSDETKEYMLMTAAALEQLRSGGNRSSYSGEGIASSKLDRLKGEYDIILIDSAPLLHSAATEYAARCADAVILVTESGATLSNELVEAIALLSRLNVAGVAAVLEELQLKYADDAFKRAVHVVEQRSLVAAIERGDFPEANRDANRAPAETAEAPVPARYEASFVEQRESSESAFPDARPEPAHDDNDLPAYVPPEPHDVRAEAAPEPLAKVAPEPPSTAWRERPSAVPPRRPTAAEHAPAKQPEREWAASDGRNVLIRPIRRRADIGRLIEPGIAARAVSSAVATLAPEDPSQAIAVRNGSGFALHLEEVEPLAHPVGESDFAGAVPSESGPKNSRAFKEQDVTSKTSWFSRLFRGDPPATAKVIPEADESQPMDFHGRPVERLPEVVETADPELEHLLKRINTREHKAQPRAVEPETQHVAAEGATAPHHDLAKPVAEPAEAYEDAQEASFSPAARDFEQAEDYDYSPRHEAPHASYQSPDPEEREEQYAVASREDAYDIPPLKRSSAEPDQLPEPPVHWAEPEPTPRYIDAVEAEDETSLYVESVAYEETTRYAEPEPEHVAEEHRYQARASEERRYFDREIFRDLFKADPQSATDPEMHHEAFGEVEGAAVREFEEHTPLTAASEFTAGQPFEPVAQHASYETVADDAFFDAAEPLPAPPPWPTHHFEAAASHPEAAQTQERQHAEPQSAPPSSEPVAVFADSRPDPEPKPEAISEPEETPFSPILTPHKRSSHWDVQVAMVTSIEPPGTEPESAHADPELARAEPESAHTEPESAHAEPESFHSELESAHAGPEPARTEPESFHPEPEPDLVPLPQAVAEPSFAEPAATTHPGAAHVAAAHVVEKPEVQAEDTATRSADVERTQPAPEPAEAPVSGVHAGRGLSRRWALLSHFEPSLSDPSPTDRRPPRFVESTPSRKIAD